MLIQAEANWPSPSPVLGHRAGDQPAYLWLDNELVPYDAGRARLLRSPFPYGRMLFEEIRTYATGRGPALFRLHDYLQRLGHALRLLGLPPEALSCSLEQVGGAINNLVQANWFQECAVRPYLYLEGAGRFGAERYHPALAIGAWPLPASVGQPGQLLLVARSDAELNAQVNGPRVAGQTVHQWLAEMLATEPDADHALLVDERGCVIAGSCESLFVVNDNLLYAGNVGPTLTGLALDTVLTLAQDLGYRLCLEPITWDCLCQADEIFVASNAAEIVPIHRLGGQAVGSGTNPITRQLQQAYRQTASGHGLRSRAWLEYVQVGPLY